MRRYEGVHLPVTASPRALRKELLRIDRWAKQVQAGFANFTKTNQPTAIVSTGGPGNPGNLPDHNHSSSSGQGGKFLGITSGTITGRGFWNFSEGLGAGTAQTAHNFLNVLKTYDNPIASDIVLNADSTFSNVNYASPGQQNITYKLKTTFQLTGNAAPPNEVRGLHNHLKITNTVSDTGATLWTNTGYQTELSTTQDVHQLIGNRVNISSAGGGNVGKFEAYAMDNAWFLATGKLITDFIVFSCPSPKVFSGNGITNFYGLRIDAPIGTITNRYGIHQSGSTTNNYFQGKIGINDTTPTSMLDATSDNAATPVISAIGASAQSADWITIMNNAGNSVGLKVPNSGLTTHSYVLPSAQGASGYALTNDGAGNLSWAAAAPANRQRTVFLNPDDFKQLNGTVAPISSTTTSSTPKGFQTFVLVDAPAVGPQSFTTQFPIPLDYVAGTAIEVWLHWTITVASVADKTWVFRYHYIARGDKEDIDGTWTTTSDTLVDNSLTGSGGDYDVGTPNYHAVTRIATDIPSTGLTTSKMMFLTIDRLSTDANDNLDKNIGFLGLELRYTAVL